MANQVFSTIASRANYAINKYYSLKTKIALLSKDIWFNNQCITNEVIPKYVGITAQSHSKAAIAASNLGRIKWVKSEIRSLHGKKQNLYEQLYKLHLEILNDKLESKMEHNNEKFKYELGIKLRAKQENLDRKLHKLMSEKHKSYEQDTENKHKFHTRTKNLTKINLNLNEIRVLDKGLKHNLGSSYNNANNLKQTIVDCERAIAFIHPAERNHTRHLLLEKLNKVKNNPLKVNQYEAKTIKNLKKKLKDNDILTLKADKGNAVVLMYKADYIEKTVDFLKTNNINEIKKDPTTKYQNNIKSAIKKIDLIMNNSDKLKIINMNPKAPNLRALPKIHKDNVPIRPIVNFRSAPGYKLSSFLQKYLKSNITLINNRSLSNSKQLINKIEGIKFDINSKMCSLDLVNMYTNIPLRGALKAIEANLFRNNINKNEIKEVITLLKLVLGQNYFMFDSKIYLQKEGLGMGSPLSGLIADIFLNEIENKMIDEIKKLDPDLQWLRYVDDVWIKYNSVKIDSETILKKCNNHSNKIQFTKEDEINGNLNYLDVELNRTDNGLIIGIYRKPTTTSHTIHASSNHPEQHKKAAFRCYINRAETIPNNTSSKEKEYKLIEHLALENGYNLNWLNNIKIKMANRRTNPINQDKKPFVKFTYINKQTNQIVQLLRNKFKFNIAFSTKNNIRNQLGNHNLNLTDKYENSGIYKLICGVDSCAKGYVGQTGRSFNTRFKEHRLSVKYGRASAFGMHAFDSDHPFTKIEDTMQIMKIINKGRDMNTYEAMEIYLERNNPNNLNEQESFGNNPLFHCLAQRVNNTRDSVDRANTIESSVPNKTPPRVVG